MMMTFRYLSSYGGTERPNEILSNGQESCEFTVLSLEVCISRDDVAVIKEFRHCKGEHFLTSSSLFSINLGFVVYNEL